MIGNTLALYISKRFLFSLFAMVLGLAFLIISVDFIEQLRKNAGNQTVALSTLYLVSVLRAPLFIEKAFPFACLFAAMISLTQLNTKMELVVARAAGVSAWQFLLPISLSAALVGVFVALIYNPAAITASEKAKELSASLIEDPLDLSRSVQRGYWVKQQDNDGGFSIINAQIARQEGRLLDNVKILRYTYTGEYKERIDALNVLHRGDHWLLLSAKTFDSAGKATDSESKTIATSLTSDDLLGVSSRPDEISFWRLRDVADRVEKSGTNGKPYLVHFHSLTALPAFLFAMVLVAATVCLRFVRFGQVGRMILGGIMFGFVLYTITSLITALGSNGVVPPIVAAWSPVFVAILFGMSALLHQEDG